MVLKSWYCSVFGLVGVRCCRLGTSRFSLGSSVISLVRCSDCFAVMLGGIVCMSWLSMLIYGWWGVSFIC